MVRLTRELTISKLDGGRGWHFQRTAIGAAVSTVSTTKKNDLITLESVLTPRLQGAAQNSAAFGSKE